VQLVVRLDKFDRQIGLSCYYWLAFNCVFRLTPRLYRQRKRPLKAANVKFFFSLSRRGKSVIERAIPHRHGCCS
jgi:hypothetical protein